MVAAAPRLPAPPNFLCLSRFIANSAAVDRSFPNRTENRLPISEASALRLVLEPSLWGVKVPGHYVRMENGKQYGDLLKYVDFNYVADVGTG